MKRNFWSGVVAGVLAVAVFLLAGLGVLLATDFYHLGRGVKVFSLIKARALEQPAPGAAVDGVLRGLVDSLGDPYSVYLGPEEYESLESHLTGTYGGVGLLITKDEEERLIVVTPFKSSPAHRAGVVTNDIITKIDGKDTFGMDLEEASDLMKGDPGTEVVLTVVREGSDQARDYPLTRENIEIPSVTGEVLADYPGIGYVNMTMFTQHTGRELNEQLTELEQQGLQAVILDLRNNPGGWLQAAVEVAERFIPAGPIVHIEERTGRQTYSATGKGQLQLPLVVLVNAGSASASEIVAGAIKDSGAGILVGGRTFGKGLVQTVFELDGGAALKLTTARYLTPDGNDINKKGIEPDFTVKMTPEEEAEALLAAPDPAKDAQLAKALEIVAAKIK